MAAKKTAGGAKPPEEKVRKANVAPKSEMEKVLDRLQRLERDNEKKDETIAMLTAVADKNALAKFEAKQDKKIVRVVKVSFWNDELITGWERVMDRVWKDNDDNWHERQVYRVFTQEGNKFEMDIRDFTDLRTKRDAKVLKRHQEYVEDKNGVEVLTETFTLQVEGIKDPVELKGNFVN